MDSEKPSVGRRIGIAFAIAVVGSLVGGLIGVAVTATYLIAFSSMGTYGGPPVPIFDLAQAFVMFVIPLLWGFGWVPSSIAQLAGYEQAATLMGIAIFGGLLTLTLGSPLILILAMLPAW